MFVNSETHAIRYDHRSVVLHWLTVVLVAVLWLLGQTIDWFPKDAPRIAARSVHIVLGVVLGSVLAYRIWWRLGNGTRVPPAGVGWLDRVATLIQILLYTLLIATVLLGITNAWVRGDNLFNLIAIPALEPDNKSLRELIGESHGLAANILLSVALFHAAAGLLHHCVFKDDVLRRMLPPRQKVNSTENTR